MLRVARNCTALTRFKHSRFRVPSSKPHSWVWWPCRRRELEHRLGLRRVWCALLVVKLHPRYSRVRRARVRKPLWDVGEVFWIARAVAGVGRGSPLELVA